VRQELLDRNVTEQYELHVQKLETNIEREFFSFPYHLHMPFFTIVVRGQGVKAAVPIGLETI
jgi:hypothetical protein